MQIQNLKRNFKPLAGGVLLGALLMGTIGSQALAVPEQAAARTSLGALPGGPASFSELVAQVKPAVVNIAIVGSRAAPQRTFPQHQRLAISRVSLPRILISRAFTTACATSCCTLNICSLEWT